MSLAEALVARYACDTFPDLPQGRLVHHLVDDRAALAGLVKGSSGGPRSVMFCCTITSVWPICSATHGWDLFTLKMTLLTHLPGALSGLWVNWMQFTGPWYFLSLGGSWHHIG